MLSVSLLLSIIGCGKKDLTAISQPTDTKPENSEEITETTTPPIQLVQPNGSYAKAPLEKEVVTLAVIQSNAESIKDIAKAHEIKMGNVNHMIEMGKKACAMDKKPDIILYHEFPLSGYIYGERDDKWKMAIEIPGAETDALAEFAKSCDAYVIFGAYAKDKDWPKHILSINTIIDRNGEIRKKVWKPRNIKRFYPTFEISTTTVESVQKEFRARYGIDDEFPVVQTEFGNIAVSTAQLDPLVFAAFAMKGTEIMLRTSTLFFQHDIIYTAMINNFYTAMSNIPYDSPYGGQSIIVAPNGSIMGQVESKTEEGIAVAEIPIAKFRKNRRLSQYSIAFTQSVFSQYLEEIPPDHLSLPPQNLPKDGKEMKILLDKKSRWLNAAAEDETAQ